MESWSNKYLSIVLITALLFIPLINQPEEKKKFLELRSAVSTQMLTKFKKAFPSYSQTQYNNAKSILDYAVTLTTDKNQLAYILATAVGESNMKPIKEKRARQGTHLWDVQEKYWGSNFMGRGYVQLTWKTNYQKFKTLLGVDFVGNPELVMNPVYAAKIIAIGMKKGKFTGVGLDRYITSTKVDFYNARRIINSVDRASTFEGYAKKIINA